MLKSVNVLRHGTICVTGKSVTIVKNGRLQQGWKTNVPNILDAIRSICDKTELETVTKLEHAALKAKAYYSDCYIVGDMIIEDDCAIMYALEALKFIGSALGITPELKPNQRIVHSHVPIEALELQQLLDDNGHWDEIGIVTTLQEAIEIFDLLNEVYEKISLKVEKNLPNSMEVQWMRSIPAPYSAFAPDQEFTKKFLEEIKKEDNVIFNGAGVHAVRIIPRANASDPLVELIGEDDGHLFSYDERVIFSMYWVDLLIKQLQEAKEYWEKNQENIPAQPSLEPYHASAPDQEFTEEFLEKIKREDNVVYNGFGVHAVRIITRENGNDPLFELIKEDDGFLSSYSHQVIFSLYWVDSLIKQLKDAKKFWKKKTQK